MKKEVILAVLLGLTLGGILVFGIYTANRARPSAPTSSSSVSTPPTPTPAPLLALDYPPDGSLFSTTTATVSGQVQPDTVIFIITEKDELLPQIESGRFSQDIKLVKGGNLIQVVAISATGQRQDYFLNLVYNTDDFTLSQVTPTATLSGVVSDEQSIKDKIKTILGQKYDPLAFQIKAFVGLIQSISQNQITITVNPGQGPAELTRNALIEPATVITRVGTGAIKPENLAIGDYIIAIGSLQDDSTVKAQEIIVDTYTPAKTKREIIYAAIIGIDPDEETITLKNGHSELKGALSVTAKTTLLSALDRGELEFDQLTVGQSVAALVFINTAKSTATLDTLLTFAAPTPPNGATCGDGTCQNVVCQGIGCPEPETPETCPADCTQ